MIEKFGIGIDVVEVSNFMDLPYEFNRSFYQKTFQKSEIDYCLKFKDSYRHFAGKFAAKEALKKSIMEDIGLLDIAILNSDSKKPIIKIKNYNNYRFLISISHEKSVAVAVVVSERIE